MTDSNSKPTLDAYLVTPTGKKKDDGTHEDYWAPIGKAFPHREAGGYTIPLGRMALNGKIVLREPKTEESAE